MSEIWRWGTWRQRTPTRQTPRQAFNSPIAEINASRNTQTWISEITPLFRLRSLPVDTTQVRCKLRAAIDCYKKERKVWKTSLKAHSFLSFSTYFQSPKHFTQFTLRWSSLCSANVKPTCVLAKRGVRQSRPYKISNGKSAGYNWSHVPARTHMRHAVCHHVTYASVYTVSMDCYHRSRGTRVQPHVNYWDFVVLPSEQSLPRTTPAAPSSNAHSNCAQIISPVHLHPLPI
jgi:hypothetical protein